MCDCHLIKTCIIFCTVDLEFNTAQDKIYCSMCDSKIAMSDRAERSPVVIKTLLMTHA